MSAIQQLITEHIDIWTAADTGKRSGRGRASSSAGSVYGIKKLRELILELAVRGKLVPQDANDEPACELLRRMHFENAKLITEGKIKYEKPLPSITEDELLFEIPLGWEWVRLDDIGSTFIGLTYSPKDISNSGTPVLRSSNIQNGKIDLIDLVRVDGNIKNNLFVNEGDLLICARNGSKSLVGKTAMIKNLDEPMVFGAFMAIYKSSFNFYVEVFLNSPVFRKFLDGVETTTINQITQNNLKTTLIPLPPITEQHRIVAKVDELMALCHQLETQHINAAEAHEKLVSHLLGTLTQSQSADDFSANWQRIAAHFDTLFTTEASIDALKQTLLQLAVMGKLVPQDANDEPASKLLKRIYAEKAELIAESKIKKDKPLTLITDSEKSFESPQGWEWVRLKDIVYVLGDGLHGTPVYTPDTECYFVNGNNLDNGQIIIKPETKTVSLGEMKKHRKNLNERTVLVSINGTIGNVAFYNNENIILGKSACYFNLANLIYKHFVKLLIESPYFMSYAFNSVSGTTIMNLSLFSMNNFPLLIPPLAEQHRIVAKVDELMTICDQLRTRITEANQLQQKLANVMVEHATAQ